MNNESQGTMSRDMLLRKIQELDFVKTELELYLDAYPTSRDALTKYYETLDVLKALTERFEGTYGPLTAGANKGETWSWIDGPWPWQKNNDSFAKKSTLDCRGNKR